MKNKCIAVGITGGIATFKICSLVSSLKKKGNDVSKMGETFDMVMEQTGKQLKDVRFDEYDSVVFVGKSIGTIAMVRYASQASLDNLKLVYITPLA
jgi:phosphopantothenoylcysteine synthetase/decarboxylase